MKPPVQWQRFNEEALTPTIGDSFSNGIGYGSGLCAIEAAKFGNGLYIPLESPALDPPTGYCTVSTTITLGTIWTIGFWIKPGTWSFDGTNITAGDVCNHFLLNYNSVRANISIELTVYENSGFTFGLYTNSGDNTLSTNDVTFTAGQWAYMTIVKNADVGMYIYKDCVLKATNETDIVSSSGNCDLAFGNRTDVQSEGMEGTIDNFVRLDYIPSAAEMKRMMNAERGHMNDCIGAF